MINILSSGTIYEAEHVKRQLEQYITPTSKICVIAFSFFESDDLYDQYIKTYTPPLGIWYNHVLNPFLTYGVDLSNVSWIIYKKDTIESAKQKLQQADIIFLPGGAPDKFFDRLVAYDLVELIKNSDKIIMGPSAGTMIQLNWYHISKDSDYKKYAIHDGLGLLNDFGVEVHYRRRKQQKKGIRRTSLMDNRPIYVIEEPGFMILEDGKIIYQYMARKYYENGKKVKY